MRSQFALFEPLAIAVVNEHSTSAGNVAVHRSSAALRRSRKLLSGERIDTEELFYDSGEWHVGAIARGEGAVSALRSLARTADRRAS